MGLWGYAMAVVKRKPKPGRNDQDAEPDLAPARLLQLYRDMLLIRRFEEKAGQMYGMGLIGGLLPPLYRRGSGGGRRCWRR